MLRMGRTIKSARVQRGMGQKELAELIGISISHLSLLERDLREPSLSTLNDIAKALRIPFFLLIFAASSEDDANNLGQELTMRLSEAYMGTFRRENADNS